MEEARLKIKIDGVELGVVTQIKARYWGFLTKMCRNSDEAEKLSKQSNMELCVKPDNTAKEA